MKRVAVVGCGLAGLAAISRLSANGFNVTVFDKSRGPGGRLASKRSPYGSFDFGAQYFTCSSSEFRDYVDSWIQQGIVDEWKISPAVIDEPGCIIKKPNSITRFVGTPRMTSISRHLEASSTANFNYSCFVTSIQQMKDNQKWTINVKDKTITDEFDHVIINLPPEQAITLLKDYSELFNTVNNVTLEPCWAVSLTFQKSLNLDIDCAFVNCGKLSWIAKHNSKPKRECDINETWVLHGNINWSKEHLEDNNDFVLNELKQDFFNTVNIQPQDISHSIVHRWRYSISKKPLTQGYIFDKENNLGICGDWCNSGKVEGAFLSGLSLANKVIQEYKVQSKV